MLKQLMLIGFFSLCVSLCQAYDKNSPVGQWVTYDDQTHQPSAIIEFYENQNTLFGKIAKIYPTENSNPQTLCHNCPDVFANQPVLGLEFLWGFTPKGNGNWVAGHILDPREGKIYKGSIRLVADGKKLNLTGYWGFFWQTHTWTRVEEVA